MSKFAVAAIALFLFSIPGQAQTNYPKAEVFGGFSIASLDGGGRETFLGWQGAVNGNFKRNFGIVADFGGQYKSISGVTLSSYQFMFGPRLFARGEKATGFVHSLFGAARLSALGISETGFAMGIGGGVDVNVSDRVAIRIPQIDWTPTRFNGNWSTSEVRIGIGLVFKSR